MPTGDKTSTRYKTVDGDQIVKTIQDFNKVILPACWLQGMGLEPGCLVRMTYKDKKIIIERE